MEDLKKYVQKAMKDNIALKDEIYDLFQLCLDEIEEGESQENEIYLCQESIRQLIEGE